MYGLKCCIYKYIKINLYTNNKNFKLLISIYNKLYIDINNLKK